MYKSEVVMISINIYICTWKSSCLVKAAGETGLSHLALRRACATTRYGRQIKVSGLKGSPLGPAS